MEIRKTFKRRNRAEIPISTTQLSNARGTGAIGQPTMDGKPIEAPWKANVVWVLVERPLDNPDGPSKPCIDQYPNEAASPGVHGTTKLTVQVAADGSVTEAAVLDTSGSKTLDDLAVVCVKKWRLSPEPQASTKTAYVSWTIPYDPTKQSTPK